MEETKCYRNLVYLRNPLTEPLTNEKKNQLLKLIAKSRLSRETYRSENLAAIEFAVKNAIY